MCLDFCVAHHECDIGEVFVFEHPQEVFGHLWLWHLNSDREHPDIVEGQFAVISSEDVELTFHDVCGVSASRSWFELTCRHFLPVVAFNIEDVDVVHPVNSVVSTEVDDLGVNQASCRRNTGTRLITAYSRFHPCQRFRVEVENVIKLSQLVWLSTEDVNLFVESYC